jgi:hypothetical protein
VSVRYSGVLLDHPILEQLRKGKRS